MTFSRIDAIEAQRLIDEDNASVVDVRDRASFETSHIAGAVHLDNDTVQQWLEQADKNQPVIVCCYHGNMSQGAADYFNSMGVSKSFSLDGGMSSWPGATESGE